MKHFIDPVDGSLHAYESDGSQDYLIPSQFRFATQAQVDAIQNPVLSPSAIAQQELSMLDATNALTQRNLREFILLATQALKLGQPVDLSVIPGIAKVASVEAQAAVLRAQL